MREEKARSILETASGKSDDLKADAFNLDRSFDTP